MTDTVYVLDASALLAAFFNEAGADVVAQRMSGALVSTINLSEVVAKLVDRGIPDDQILEIMDQLDVEIVPVDQEQALTAGFFRKETRSAGLSLGDRTCLALARVRNAVALTSDRDWSTIAEEVGVEVMVIR